MVLCFSLLALIDLTQLFQRRTWIQMSIFSTQISSFRVNTWSTSLLYSVGIQQMHRATYCKVPNPVFCGWIWCAFISMKDPDHVAYEIFSIMLGIFRPSTDLGAAVRFEASVKSYPFTGQCLEQLSFPVWQRVETLSSPKHTRWHHLPVSTPPLPVYHHWDSDSKLDKKRIKMGDLSVIPCTTVKRAICLINSLWPSSIFPSSRPPTTRIGVRLRQA